METVVVDSDSDGSTTIPEVLSLPHVNETNVKTRSDAIHVQTEEQFIGQPVQSLVLGQQSQTSLLYRPTPTTDTKNIDTSIQSACG